MTRHDLGKGVCWESASVGQLIEVNLSHTGLCRATVLQLYIRQMCMELHAKLKEITHGTSLEISQRISRKASHETSEETPDQILMVHGCPGVGKSVEVYSFAMSWARKYEKRILYIHYDQFNGLSIIFKDDANDTTSKVCHIPKFGDSIDLLPFVEDLVIKCKVDLIVLDGALSKLIQAVYLMLGKYLQTKMITCTSYRALGRISGEAMVKAAQLGFFTMESWSKKEYERAILAGALRIQISELDERYFYAGGSVRYLQLPIKEVIKHYELKILRVKDMSKLVGTGGIGDASDDAVNSLMAIHNKCNTIVSKFVSKKLLDQITDDWIAKARVHLDTNPVWQGWVTDYEVLTLAKYKKLFFYAPLKEPESWPSVTAPIEFDNAESPVLRDENHVGWFYPLKWNHECFDALFRVSKDVIRVVQISDASTHSWKLEYLIPYVVAMKVKSVDFVFICRRRNFETFKIPKISLVQEQYDSLIKQLIDNEAKNLRRKKRKRGPLTDYFNFRKVCYQT